MKNLARILITICCLANNNSLFSQPFQVNDIIFFDYTTILNDLIKNDKKSMYYENLDYEAMLYLDKNSIQVLAKVNPEFLLEHDIDTTSFFYGVTEKYINELPVNFSNIKELFATTDTWKSIVIQLNNIKCNIVTKTTIDNKIYTKNDKEAIFTINNLCYNSITYRVILKNNKLRFEALYWISE